MSFSSSISNAFSGLAVTARAAQLVSSNLANALNEDYSRREIEVASYHQGGAKFVQNNRFVDRVLTADLRNARSNFNISQQRSKSTKALELSVGAPENPASLTAHLARFDASLRYLESDPFSTVRLKDTLSTASALASKFGSIEADIQTQRNRADTQIAASVTSLNSKLRQIATLNHEIVSAKINGHETNTWLDQRKSLIDDVSAIVPVREMRRDNGAISLVSASGVMLIEKEAVQFEFTKTNLIMPHMTIESGELSALKLGTDHIDLSSNSGPLSGGSLQGLFEIRDKTFVEAQKNIDTLALEFAERFHNLPSDSSSTATSPGLFTDHFDRVDGTFQNGLAGRLTVNPNVDPSQGGELWRLRSGLQATSKSASGDSSLIGEMIKVLSGAGSNGSVIEQASEIVSSISQMAAENEQQESFASAHFEQLRTLHLEHGVNTDAELQKLLQIETNYAANAKVMQAIDEMFAAILRIN